MFSKCLFESLFPFPVDCFAKLPYHRTAPPSGLFQQGFSILSDFGLLAHSVVSPVILLHDITMKNNCSKKKI
jgi:hypothetical protein